ncbi:ATP-binding protein [Desulfovibrio desulfuricans]|uniref:ATP-binding protein n=1 Tax=Desulfovibrio desulfuricans TaxID=876 RepID=UPI0003B39A18|nr:ATP-binding protein [Desulfovibrio desulfuricans]
MSLLRSLPAVRGQLAARYSPWLIIGMTAILGLAIFILAFQNAQREKAYMSQNLMDRANSLIWALEAGTRTGMGMNSNSRAVQSLLEETAKQPGIVYMAVTDRAGILLAHSEPQKVGQSLYSREVVQALGVGEKSRWRTTESTAGASVFEVYRTFSPLPGFHRHMWHGSSGGGDCRDCSWGGGKNTGHGMPPSADDTEDNVLIFVGLDVKPFEDALAEDFRNTLITAVLVGLLGLGGFASLFWAQSYRRSRRMLQDTRAFASEVVTSLPIGLLTTDTEYKVTLVNEAAATILGKSEELLTGKHLAAVQNLDWNSILKRLGAGNTILEEEHSLTLPEGTATPVSISASGIINEEGVNLGCLFLLRDLREVKRLQEQLRRSERLSVLGNMAARVAHEIRNPLSSIKGLATYFSEKNTTEQDKEFSATMISEVDRLNRVVSELLDFARPTVLKLQDSDINAVIERSLRLVEADATTKGITVSFSPNPALPLLLVDSERLTQAFLNLFINAVQSMATGGTLRVTAKMADDSRIAVEIADTGKGIPADIAANIFNPYYTTKATGTGLGLAVVQKILEDHHGEIKMSSAVGQGSVFTLLLPQKDAQ